ncbi:METTL5 family protein [Halobacteria archaeon AArc-dxtr1]|nr:METTL5 family protein [Halobacteria archaeon AArc-dxtr1]
MEGPDRRSLARALEFVDDFSDPSVALEQYLTPAEVGAHVCQLAQLQADLAGRTVVDLGTGTGLLAIGAAAYAPSRVVGVDVDAGALALARENAQTVRAQLESDATASPIDWVRADATQLPLSVDGVTVLSNPPFGAQRGSRHADRAFLETARSIAAVSYTIHNEGSQKFVESFAADAGATVTHAFRAPFEIERRFAFHADASRTVEAEVFRIEWA